MDEQEEPFYLQVQGSSGPLSKPHWCLGPQVTGEQAFNVTEYESWQGPQHLSILIPASPRPRLGKALGSSYIVI